MYPYPTQKFKKETHFGVSLQRISIGLGYGQELVFYKMLPR
jgi:hypothetical protein